MSRQGSPSFPERTKKTTRNVGEGDWLAKLLLQVTDGGLAACIFVVPMILGGRAALGRLALVALSLAVAMAWTVRQCLRKQGIWRWSSAESLLLAGAVLLVLQLAPLPPALLAHLAPHTSEMLPLWSSHTDIPVTLGVWSQVSLTPAATRDALVIFLAYGLLFLVAVQRIRVVEDVERILRWCAWSALLMAAFGLVQLLTSNGKFFWIYEHVYTTTRGVAKGAFANRNHFAHFLALGIGPLIWWVQEGLGRGRKWSSGFRVQSSGLRLPRVLASPEPRTLNPEPRFRRSASKSDVSELGIGFRVFALGIVLFAVLLSLSRGGAVATLVATVLCVGVCYRASSMGLRFVVSLTAVVLLIGASLAIFGYERVSGRLDDLTSGSLETLDRQEGRRTIWQTVAKAIPDFVVLGSGVGSHREVYPMYLEWADSYSYYSHAECGYLQVTLESGMAGLALLLTGIGICGFWCIDGLRTASERRILVCLGAVSGSLAASLAHSTVDFVWYVPGCMVLVAVLAACACRLRQLALGDPDRGSRQTTFPRHVGVISVFLLLVGGAWMLENRAGPVLAEPHWERFLLLRRDAAEPLPFGDWQGENTADDQEDQPSLAAQERMVAQLEDVLRCDPNHARAHLNLARAYIGLFHHKQATSANRMPLSQIRDAVIQSRSEAVPPERRLDSREAVQQWLSRAVGDHSKYLQFALEHARRAVELCPLLGEGYLFLGELCFLEGGRTLSKAAFVSQALTVRPFDGTVLFHAGNEAVLAGDLEQGLAYWQESFASGSVYQKQIIDWLAGRVHPEDLEGEIRFLIDTFQPDLEGLRLLDGRYQEIARPEQMIALRRDYVRAVESEAATRNRSEAVDLWLEAMRLYEQLDDPARRLQCGQHALSCDPNNFRVRRDLAYCLADLEQYQEAKKHLDWCLMRKPDDQVLSRKMKEVDQTEIWHRPQASAANRPSQRRY